MKDAISSDQEEQTVNGVKVLSFLQAIKDQALSLT